MTADTLHTLTFSLNAASGVRAAAKRAGVDLVDRSVEVGIYDRDAFETTLAEWGLVWNELASDRETLRGTDRRVATAAMGRIFFAPFAADEPVAQKQERIRRLDARIKAQAKPEQRRIARGREHSRLWLGLNAERAEIEATL